VVLPDILENRNNDLPLQVINISHDPYVCLRVLEAHVFENDLHNSAGSGGGADTTVKGFLINLSLREAKRKNNRQVYVFKTLNSLAALGMGNTFELTWTFLVVVNFDRFSRYAIMRAGTPTRLSGCLPGSICKRFNAMRDGQIT
jgi:hypothetical protein